MAITAWTSGYVFGLGGFDGTSVGLSGGVGGVVVVIPVVSLGFRTIPTPISVTVSVSTPISMPLPVPVISSMIDLSIPM